MINLLIALLLLLACSSCMQTSVQFYPYERVIQLGDDLAWAAKDYDHSNWDKSGSTDQHAVFWVRFKQNLSSTYLSQVKTKGIRIISVGSYEAYWDGQYIGSSGEIGNSQKTEIPGQFFSHLRIPDSLAGPGEHTLALRVSRFHGPTFSTWHTYYIGEYFSLGRPGLVLTALMFILGGAFLSIGVYYFLLFLSRKQDHTRLIFSGICFLFFALLVMEYLKFIYLYPYPFHHTRLVIILVITLTLAILLPWFFLAYFELSRKHLWISVWAFSLLTFCFTNEYSFDTVVHILGVLGWAGTTLIALIAWWQGKTASHIILAVLLCCLAIPNWVAGQTLGLFLFDYDVSLFLSFALLVFTQIYLLARRTQMQQQAYEDSLLRSVRLQNELLRKNIQPHFILNSLTSLMDWVEESPKESVAFIEALAEEFAAFHAISDQKLAVLPKLLHLCKSHLKIMSYRKEIDYEWVEENLDYQEQFPPGVLLTLVENGVTHSKAGKDGKVKFLLSFARPSPQSCQYKLTVTAPIRERTKHPGTGTGLRYLRSRLEENYGNNWTLAAGPHDEGWQTTITFNP